MNNLNKYNDVFKECFNVTEDQLNEMLVYNSIEEWDSVGHMAMVAELEDVFDIMLETDDVIEFSSYTIGIEILKKYDVQV
ncbi:acyl carrier protein [Lysinibacillus capsici]|uniref:acyl carrier protein n=1 Tax=Lysinibacillus capsici TaxID=2115968 RepID=UPI0028BDA857|nr:acyl carrier protein [Lysinibacillus capsici]WNN76926.1 acyl carrier protein [Lysinibacillus capsici]WPK06104.1 acyl carrier protein [Lysinibacillus capsici]